MTYSEIVRRARHAASSVKRNVETFGRVVVLWEKGMREPLEIGFMVGISERLARRTPDTPDGGKNHSQLSSGGIEAGGRTDRGHNR